MIVKWIVCDVPFAKREAFSRAQEAWQKIAWAEGFLGQVGGWEADDSPAVLADGKAAPSAAGLGGADAATGTARACILSLWRDREAYEYFFEYTHDAVTYKNGQAAAYRGIDIQVATSLIRLPGAATSVSATRSLREALRRARGLRLADCRIHARRQDHFIDMQLRHWGPGMREAPGMLGGVFSVVSRAVRRFLVATLWEDAASHQAYRRDALPGLQARTGAVDDLESITGRFVTLNDAWRVVRDARKPRSR